MSGYIKHESYQSQDVEEQIKTTEGGRGLE